MPSPDTLTVLRLRSQQSILRNSLLNIGFIPAMVDKRIYCVGEKQAKMREEFNISWHRGDETKASQNNDNPKRDPAYHKRENNCEERFAYLDFARSNVAE